ncbi:MAG: DUF1573 domain-containing protein [Muribaculum sp.]|nr:DUF1573 domain-containing protein [Muribaculum sp.]
MNTSNIKALNIASLILCLFLALPMMAKKKEAKINFTEDTYDFGQVSVKKGNVTHEFTFTNTGDSNLVIINAKADCGCTKPVYSEEPIAPDKTGNVKVTFVPNGKGHFTKKVTITTNGSPRKVRLLIKGEVIP